MIRAGELELFEYILQDIFNLKCKPVTRFSRQIKYQRDECYGFYDGEPLSKNRYLHKIRISRKLIKTSEGLFSTMAHEYVHAWQMEKGLDVYHDKASKFDYWQNYFSVRFNIDIVGMI